MGKPVTKQNQINKRKEYNISKLAPLRIRITMRRKRRGTSVTSPRNKSTNIFALIVVMGMEGKERDVLRGTYK